MSRNTRREFLADVGRGMLLAGLGTELAAELGLSTLEAAEPTGSLDFGHLEPLVSLMQETPPEKLTARLVEKIQAGTDLKTLVAAGALANARTFGGHDYVGFHTFMALAPSYYMAQALPSEQRPLPVLKVLYRNANRIQEFGGRSEERLRPVRAEPIPQDAPHGHYLREMSRTGDIARADQTFATMSDAPIGEAFNHLQFALQDEVDVHRIVLAWRAWDTRSLAGDEWGHLLLRQSVHYCANSERRMIEKNRSRSDIRSLLPRLFDEYSLAGRTPGNRVGDDAWLQELADVIFRGSRAEAAEAVAAALSEGYSPESIGEAMSLAANRLVLHDPGRSERAADEARPVGSVHGASVGVHASDAANAWRNIARVSNARNVMAGMIVGAFHTAGQVGRVNDDPFPTEEQLAGVQTADAGTLLHETEAAIRSKDQFRAAALISHYGQQEFDPQPVFNLMLKFATSEDGALHAEKYYQTVTEEYANIRPAFRWGQLVALARVTASQYGFRSDGYEQAKDLLKLS
ncbi:hypothetical protein Mal4_02940 [Maioricimonas rarisocia]|uniref:Uncharacterized protein n=1 Tax=Maioricimonas rarisocia TaxID=2528026 RepID=A0A517Z0J2_9PLAN|nr:hypothetical protein [Maioricimonas rarisocia]QDU36011.1 hypothetical protein Mal4_02940 [Maioricimonas rarisocia]